MIMIPKKQQFVQKKMQQSVKIPEVHGKRKKLQHTIGQTANNQTKCKQRF